MHISTIIADLIELCLKQCVTACLCFSSSFFVVAGVVGACDLVTFVHPDVLLKVK